MMWMSIDVQHVLRQALREQYATTPADQRDEMGIPSYLHANPVMRYVYWSRVRIALRLAGDPRGDVLDFGCGPGVLLPLIAPRVARVYAVDEHPDNAQALAACFALSNVEYATSLESASIAPASLRTIFAMDVLEHVDDLDQYLSQFAALLAPEGRLIISGPTENALYKLGRWLAGFSGVYHLRSIYDILAVVKTRYRVTQSLHFPTFAPLFVFAVCEAKS